MSGDPDDLRIWADDDGESHVEDVHLASTDGKARITRALDPGPRTTLLARPTTVAGT